MFKRGIQRILDNTEKYFAYLEQELNQFKKQIKPSNSAKNHKNVSYFSNVEYKEDMTFASKNIQPQIRSNK